MNLIKIILLVVFIFPTIHINAQKIKCNYCNREIVGQYIVVDGLAFHKEHFKCANCNRKIVGKYFKKNGKYYDEKCYAEKFMPKCSICGEPISGEYLIDSYGMKIHKYHQNNLITCDNCNRVISKKMNNRGVKYSDGRNICNVCYKNRIKTDSEYWISLRRVINRLSNYSLSFDLSSIKIKPVDLNELQNVSGNKYSRNIKGFTLSQIETSGTEKKFKHTIYVLSKIPREYLESTIAHELMHVWISENIKYKLNVQLEEGSCNYVSYTFLKAENSTNAKNTIKQLKENPDRIYGDGYRKVYERFVGRDFKLFLDYLKKNDSI